MNNIRNRTSSASSVFLKQVRETRRRTTVNSLLWGIIVAAGMACIVLLLITITNPTLIPKEDQQLILLGAAVFFVFSAGMVLLNRYISTLLASYLFTLAIILAFSVSDTPKHVLQERTLPFFVLPMIVATLLIHPMAGYIIAALVSLASGYFAVVILHGIPNFITMIFFFIITYIIQQFTSNLERVMEQEQRKNRALVESEDRYRKIIETAPNGMVIVDLQGSIKDCNQAFLKSAGLSSKQELIGRDGYQLIHPDERSRTAGIMTQMLQTGSATGMEIKGWREDGVSLIYEFSASMVTDWEGKYSSIVCAFQDITERKRMENELRHSEERYRALIESSSDVTAILGKDGTIQYTSPSAERLTGYKTDELTGQNIFSFIHPEDVAIAIAALGPNVSANAIGPMLVLRLRHQNGTWVFMEVVGTEMYTHPAIMGTIVNCRSITERIQVENELRASNQLLESTLASIDDAVFIIDNNTDKINSCNPAASEMFGYSRGEILTRTPGFFYESENARDEFMKLLDQAINEKGFLSHFEYKMKRKDGIVFPIESSVRPLNGPDGKKYGWVSVIHDITERKKAEEALRESEQKYKALIETTETGFLILDAEGKVVDANAEYVRLTGRRDLNEILGCTVVEWTASYDRERNARAVEQCAKDGFVRDLDIDYVDPKGNVAPVEINATVVQIAGNTRIISLCRDITGRKRLEADLRESEEKFAKAFQLNPAPMLISDMKGLYAEVNQAFIQKFGYSQEEVAGRTVEELNIFIEPEQIKQAHDIFLREGRIRDYEVTTRSRSGEIFQVVFYSERLRLNQRPIILSVMTDITERKRMEQKLRESEEKFSKAFQFNPAPMAISGIDGRYIEVNQAFVQTLGFSQEEVAGRTPIELGIDVQPDQNRLAMEILRERRRLQNHELDVRTRSGEILHGEFFAEFLQLNNRHLILTMMNDITQRKQAEAQLCESEAKYHRLIDLLPIGVGIHQKGRIALINPMGAKLMGAKNPDELLGAPLMDFIHPDYRELAQARIKESVAKGTVAGQEEEKFIRRDGTAFDGEVTALPFGMGDGEPSMLVVFDDITDRKQAQEAIALQNQRIQEVSRQLVKVQEREKHMLAAELHDDLGQSLTSLKLMLELASTTRSSAIRKQELEKTRGLVTELMDKVRNLSLDLRPAMLDDFGLFAALHWLFERFRSQTGITIQCTYDLESNQRFEPAVETAVFRIIQEALTNVARHASVKEAQVRLTVDNMLSVEIVDQGSGFDHAAKARQATGSSGVAGMQERAHLLGGHVEIHSELGSGTRVLAQIPLAGVAA